MRSGPSVLDGPVGRLVAQFCRLPGIGEKTATRLALHILKAPGDLARDLARSLVEVKERVRPCGTCFLLTDTDPCGVCADTGRDPAVLCVVAGTADVMALERTGAYLGRYHVLGGLLAPLDGVGPEALTLRALAARLESGQVEEVILALSPSVDGEATAHYVGRLARSAGVRVTRIAAGIPIGTDIEWTDTHTLARALMDRREVR